MKTYILILLTTIFSIATKAQAQTVTKSEKTGFYVSETETTYTVKSSFPISKYEIAKALLIKSLGEADLSLEKASRWSGAYYEVNCTIGNIKISLNKENSTSKQLAKFKKLTADLQNVLGQPSPPAPPTVD